MDTDLTIWRLRKAGHTVLGYRDVVLNYTTDQDDAIKRLLELRRCYPDGLDEISVASIFTSRTPSGGYVYLQWRGGKFSFEKSHHIEDLMKTLLKLHSLNTNFAPPIIENNLLENGKYSVKNVWNHFYADSKTVNIMKKNTDINRIREDLVEMANDILGVKVAVIHGDLNQGNILVFNNGVKLIDWSDVRLDNPYLDIAQVVFHSGLDINDAESLARMYNNEIKLDQLLYFLFLSMLWVAEYMPDDPRFRPLMIHWAESVNEFQIFKKIGVA